MNIGFDASMIDSNKAGIGYYAYSLLKQLHNIDKSNDYIIFTNNRENLIDFNFDNKFRLVEIESEAGNLRWMWKVYRTFKKNDIDVFISPSNLFFGTVFSNTITIIHDLAKIKYPQFFSKKGSYLYRIQLNLLLRREKVIVVPSEAVKKELEEYSSRAKNKTYSIPEGLHEWTKIKVSEETLRNIKEKYGLGENYFLSLGTLEPRKNYVNAIKAFNNFAKSNNNWNYLIAGKKGWYYNEIFGTVKRLSLKNKVRFLGYVPEEDLPALIDLSKGVLVPSFYEGFGLPIIEASSRGKVVLASNIPVFKEVLNKNIVFINPEDSDSIKNGMEALKNSTFKNESNLFVKYNWKRVAEELVNLYKTAI